VPDACAELYTQEALDAQREPLRHAAMERIKERLAELDDLPIEREGAAAAKVRNWLAAAFVKVLVYADTRDQVYALEASTTPRTVVIEVWVHGSVEHLRYVPRSLAAFQALLGGDGDRVTQNADSERVVE
jgi:hypothetical protein